LPLITWLLISFLVAGSAFSTFDDKIKGILVDEPEDLLD